MENIETNIKSDINTEKSFDFNYDDNFIKGIIDFKNNDDKTIIDGKEYHVVRIDELINYANRNRQ